MDRADLYTYRVIWSEEDEEFVGLCAEFPSLSWLAKKRHAALDGVTQLVREAVLDMERAREAHPHLQSSESPAHPRRPA